MNKAETSVHKICMGLYGNLSECPPINAGRAKMQLPAR